MKSSAPVLQTHDGSRSGIGFWTASVKAMVGLALLAALFFFGQIDVRALLTLIEMPSVLIVSIGLVLLTLPLAALRWSLLLRAFGLSIAFIDLLHFVAIGTLTNLLLFGPVGGDAVRAFYAWQALGRGSGRVVISVLADRLLGLFGLLSIAFTFSLLNWRWMKNVPALADLGQSLFLAFAACIIGVCAVFFAPRVGRHLIEALSRWPRLVTLVTHLATVVRMIRTNPLALLASFGLSVLIQTGSVAAVLVIAEALNIGTLSITDYAFAISITLVVNALPLTPNGVGVGEAAFDLICRWLEAAPSGAPYASIFFAFRAASLVVSMLGLVSFALYGKPVRRDLAEKHMPPGSAGEAVQVPTSDLNE
jgi:glycosyltransferase 2 family protein